MGRERKKGASGTATQYITRSHATKKLQISLQDFRKLCILKGVYPREPKKKFRGTNKTYYLTKDINFLMHDPLLVKFRKKKTFRKKVRKAKGRKEFDTVRRLQQNQPVYRLDHIIKERYPTFIDALRDLDDALCLIHLFASLPQTVKIPSSKTKKCARLCHEFHNYIALTHSLRKVFLSIKGIYYQAELQGMPVTWLVPYHFSQQLPKEVDFRMMLTFLEFYTTLMGFVLFKLYTSQGYNYPPTVDSALANHGEGLSALVLHPATDSGAASTETTTTSTTSAAPAQKPQELTSGLQEKLRALKDKGKEKVDDAEETNDEYGKEEEEEGQEEAKELQQLSAELLSPELKHHDKFSTLFANHYFFLSREVPRESLEFVIKSFGGKVSWDGCVEGEKEGSDAITHHILDRPTQQHRFLNREYVQPQWIYDCANLCHLLPTHEYLPGVELPPHLSPFVDPEAGGYVPKRQEEFNILLGKASAASTSAPTKHALTEEQELAKMEEQFANELAKETSGVNAVPASPVKKRKIVREKDDYDEKKAASYLLSRKKKKLWDRIERTKKSKERKKDKLMRKRRKIEAQNAKKQETA